MIKSAPRPLSNIQEELLRLYSTGISDEQLSEIKDVIAKYFFQKAIDGATKVAEEKGYTQETFDSWLNED
jgi:signal-transduction protein with cAMP-binding, CBS, and nucleotidyltransferase domain